VSGHRQAAVALHALAEGDRASILTELPAADQQTLRGYLAELDELGFDRETLAAAGAATAPARPLVQPAARLQAASASTMFGVLKAEPSALVAQLLNVQDWPWAGELVHLFPAPKRDAIRAARALHTAAAPARSRFLLDAVASRVADQAVTPTDSSWIGALRTKVAAWTR
jgi:hypothetical protein